MGLTVDMKSGQKIKCDKKRMGRVWEKPTENKQKIIYNRSVFVFYSRILLFLLDRGH